MGAKFCPDCGAALVGSGKFCAECGVGIAAAVAGGWDAINDLKALKDTARPDEGSRPGVEFVAGDEPVGSGSGRSWATAQRSVIAAHVAQGYFDPIPLVPVADRYREVTGVEPPTGSSLGSLVCAAPSGHPHSVDGSVSVLEGLIRGSGFRSPFGRDPSLLGSWTALPVARSKLASRVRSAAGAAGLSVGDADDDDFALVGVWHTGEGSLIPQVARFFLDDSGQERCFWYVDALAYSADPGFGESGPDQVWRREGGRLTIGQQSMLAGLPQLLQRLFYVAEHPFPSTVLVSFPRTDPEGVAAFPGLPGSLAPEPRLHSRFQVQAAAAGYGGQWVSAGEPRGADWSEGSDDLFATAPVVASVGYLMSDELTDDQLTRTLPALCDALLALCECLEQGAGTKVRWVTDGGDTVRAGEIDLQLDTQSLAGLLALLDPSGASPPAADDETGGWVVRPGADVVSRLGWLLVSSSLESGDLDTARVTLGALAIDGDADALTELGKLSWEAGDQDAARDWYTRAAAAGSISAMLNLGHVARADADTATAAACYRQVIDSGADQRATAAAMANLGDLLGEEGRAAEAATMLMRAADSAPDQQTKEMVASLINTLAFSALIPQGNRGEAREVLQRAIDLDAGYQSANAMSNLGIVEYEEGNLVLAGGLFQRIVEGGEGPIDEAHFYLGLIVESGGDSSLARQLWMRVAEGEDQEYAAKARLALGRTSTPGPARQGFWRRKGGRS